MTKKQLEAQLMSAREQAEMNMPSLVSYFDEMMELVNNFDQEDENRQIAITETTQNWIKYVQEYGGEKGFEQHLQRFRKVADVGDGKRCPKDAAWIAYLTMYGLDLATSICCIDGGMKTAAEESDQYTHVAVVDMIENKAEYAKCFLQSLGVDSPQEAIIQLDWITNLVRKKTKEANMTHGDANDLKKDGSINWKKGKRKPKTIPNTDEYKRGFIDGLKAYAWWKDKEEQVGTCGTTLKKAIKNAEQTWNYKITGTKNE